MGSDDGERERDLGRLLDVRGEHFYRIAWRLAGGDTAAAGDVVQDAAVRALRGVRRFRGDGSLEAWFVRILVRVARNQRRWAAVRLRHSAPEADVEQTATRGRAGDVLLRRRIVHAVRSLRGAQREVFVLVHLEGYTVSEASKLLGRSEGTVKSHLHRALVKLRKVLERTRDPGV